MSNFKPGGSRAGNLGTDSLSAHKQTALFEHRLEMVHGRSQTTSFAISPSSANRSHLLALETLAEAVYPNTHWYWIVGQIPSALYPVVSTTGTSI